MDDIQKRIFYYLTLNGLKNYLNYPDYNKKEKIKALEKITEETFKNINNLDSLDKKIFNLYYCLLEENEPTIIKISKRFKISKTNTSKRKMRGDKAIISYYLLKILNIKPIEKTKKKYNQLEKYKIYKDEVTQLRNTGYTWKEVCEELKINFRTAKKAFNYNKFL